MTITPFNKVWETAVNPGIGTVSLLGARTDVPSQSTGFNVVGDGNSAVVCISQRPAPGLLNPLWELATMQFTLAGRTLTRLAGNVIDGSSGPGVLVNFTGPGTLDVAAVEPALRPFNELLGWSTAGTGIVAISDSELDFNLAGVNYASVKTDGLHSTGGKFSGLITGTLGAIVSGAAVSINGSGAFPTTINGGTSTGLVSIGNFSSGNVVITSGGSVFLQAENGNAVLTVGSSGISLSESTSNGITIGTASTQKVGFLGATPVAQISGSTDPIAGLVTQGLRAATSNPPLNIGTGALTAGSANISAAAQSILGAAANPADTNADFLYTPSGAGKYFVFDTSSTQPLVVRQIGGTAGTTEEQIYHDGTNAVFNNPATSGTHKFNQQVVLPNGSTSTPSVVMASSLVTGWFAPAGTVISFTDGTNRKIDLNNGGLTLSSDFRLLWGSSNNLNSASVLTGITRNADGVVEVNNGTAGTFRDFVARTVSINSSTIGTPGSLGSLYVPYDTNAGETDGKGGNQNGAIVVNNADSKIYARENGSWKGVAIAGWSIPKNGDVPPMVGRLGAYHGSEDHFDETICPVCRKRMGPLEPLALLGDRYYQDSGLHAYTAHFVCVATKLGFTRGKNMADQVTPAEVPAEDIHRAHAEQLEKQRKDHEEQKAALQKQIADLRESMQYERNDCKAAIEEWQSKHGAERARANAAEKERDEHKALLLAWESDLKGMLGKHGKTPAEIRREQLLRQKAELEKQLEE